MMQKHSFPSNYRGNYILGSVSDVLSSFCVFVPTKIPKKPDFFNIFCKKSGKKIIFFSKSVKMAEAWKPIRKTTFHLIFFATFPFLLLIYGFWWQIRFFDFSLFFWKIALKYVHFRGLDNFPTFFTFVLKWK